MSVIDITDLVEKMKAVWIKVQILAINAALAAVPGVGAFLNLPVISFFKDLIITKIVTFISNEEEMGAFFFNTAIRKASQAKDFTDAVDFRNSLPPTASNEEYENAEKKQMQAFSDFVVLTN